MSPENERPSLVLVLFCAFLFFTIFVALFSQQFLYSSNFEWSFSYFFLICSQQVNCLTQALTQYSQLYYLRNKLKLKRFKKIWISKDVSLQNAWQPARLKRRSWKRNKLRWRKKFKPNWAFLLLGEVLTAGLKKISKNLKILVSAMPTFCMPHSQFHTAPNLNFNSFPDFFGVGRLTLPKWSVCSCM